MAGFASITDMPIQSGKDNLLGIENYAQALADFIKESDTPLTIGIQGEWGTGKTSLMHLIKERFEAGSIAFSWVNTWEHALFKDASVTTPSVMRGMLEGLRLSCGKAWPDSPGVSDKMKRVGTFMANLANQAVASRVGLNALEAYTASKGESAPVEIAQIKEEISGLIQDLVSDPKNGFRKVVFLLDDLDRIDPPVAVEILEALKNIFDIKNCIFILAIDYDVVIKGLEKKFGAKTEKNEREFRSFFDKIIQVPFTMPIGAYKIDQLLLKTFADLDLDLDEGDRRRFTKITELTVGCVPRSVKRFINTYSLLKRIRGMAHDLGENGASEETAEADPRLIDFMLFALIGLQISFPSVYRLLSKSPDFTAWDEALARQHDIDDLGKVELDHEYTDEDWEKFLYLYCQREPYLKSRVLSVIELLNLLRDEAKDELQLALSLALDFASMTAVDDDVAAKQGKSVDQGMRRKNRNRISALAEQLNTQFAGQVDAKLTGKFKRYQARQAEDATVYTWLKFGKEAISIEAVFHPRSYRFQSCASNKKSRELGKAWLSRFCGKDGELPVTTAYVYARFNETPREENESDEAFFNRFRADAIEFFRRGLAQKEEWRQEQACKG